MGDNPSKILLRTHQSLHRRLLNQAKLNKQSLNDLCLERLSVPSSLEGKPNELARIVVATADLLFKDKLHGVVFYGSQARREAWKGSDWDFLIVIDKSIKLTRNIYRAWDDLMPSGPDQQKGDIEVHFAQKPQSTDIATGFWSEISLDGIILFERDFAVSLHLIRTRHEIASGIIVRQNIHGQSYWIRRENA